MDFNVVASHHFVSGNAFQNVQVECVFFKADETGSTYVYFYLNLMIVLADWFTDVEFHCSTCIDCHLSLGLWLKERSNHCRNMVESICDNHGEGQLRNVDELSTCVLGNYFVVVAGDLGDVIAFRYQRVRERST